MVNKNYYDLENKKLSVLMGYTFKYQLRGKDGNILQTIKNDDDTIAAFAALTYDNVGTYEYTVNEIANEADDDYDPNIVYDYHIYDVKVTVTAPENLQNGTALTATAEYTKRGETANGVVFTNHHRRPGSVQLNAVKTLDGKTPRAKAFAFELYKVVNGEETLVETAYNDEAGVVRFKKMTFSNIDYSDGSHMDVHQYVIREVIGENTRDMLYDNRVYNVELVVSNAHPTHYKIIARIHRESVDGTDEHITIEEGTDITVGLDEDGKIIFENETIDIPKTGDNSRLLAWATLLALCGAAAVITVKKRRGEY